MPERALERGKSEYGFLIFSNYGNILDLDGWIEISKKDLEK
jgi:hypothetical protein